eukprot:6566496-Pyramimonas_sp.AAC.1
MHTTHQVAKEEEEEDRPRQTEGQKVLSSVKPVVDRASMSARDSMFAMINSGTFKLKPVAQKQDDGGPPPQPKKGARAAATRPRGIGFPPAPRESDGGGAGGSGTAGAAGHARKKSLMTTLMEG